MKTFKFRREPPALRRLSSLAARSDGGSDASDPVASASRSAALLLGAPSVPVVRPDPSGEPAGLSAGLSVGPSSGPVLYPLSARTAGLTSNLTADDIGDLSAFYPSPEMIAAFRSVAPDYEPPTGEVRARNFLSDYLLCSSLLGASKILDRSPLGGRPSPHLSDNVAFWRSRCRSVAALINSLPASREKILLTFRYLHGLPIEVCAERLYVSRRTAYRLHRRALSLVSHALDRHWRQTRKG